MQLFFCWKYKIQMHFGLRIPTLALIKHKLACKFFILNVKLF